MSTHKQATKKIVDDLLENDAEWRDCLYDYLRKLKSGYFHKETVDSLLQKFERFPYDIYDAYCYAKLHHLLLTEKIASALVYKGATPRGDKEIEYHNFILAKREDSHFFGEFWGGLADDDGYFSWDVPLNFEVKKGSLTDDKIERKSVIIEPRRLPLEVGYTAGSTTILHLFSSGGVARWPYGSEDIFLYILTDESLLGSNILSRALQHKDDVDQTSKLVEEQLRLFDFDE